MPYTYEHKRCWILNAEKYALIWHVSDIKVDYFDAHILFHTIFSIRNSMDIVSWNGKSLSYIALGRLVAPKKNESKNAPIPSICIADFIYPSKPNDIKHLWHFVGSQTISGRVKQNEKKTSVWWDKCSININLKPFVLSRKHLTRKQMSERMAFAFYVLSSQVISVLTTFI